MERQLIETQITDLLETINEQYEMLRANTNILPRIEIDILQANVRNLYEKLLLLNKFTAPAPGLESSKPKDTPVHIPAQPEVQQIPVIPVVPAAPLQEPVQSGQPEIQPPVIEKQLNEPEPVEISPVLEAEIKAVMPSAPAEEITLNEEIVSARQPEIPPVVTQASVQEEKNPPVKVGEPVPPVPAEIKTEANSGKKEEEKAVTPISKSKDKPAAMVGSLFEGQILADTFESKPSLADRMAVASSKQPLAQKLIKQPIPDLNKAVGLNEKIRFINELFGGNSQAYSKHIEAINTRSDYEEAQDYLAAEVVNQFSWDLESPTVAVFLDLIDRRFLH